MNATRSLLLLLPVLLLAGCAAGEDEAAFTPGGCGLAPYAWLPASQVGRVVSHGELAQATTAEIDLQLILFGLEALTPAAQGTRLLELRYTTQDRGAPVEASGYLALPWSDGPTGRAHPVMLYLHGTSGVAHECAQGTDGDLLRSLAMLIAAMGYVGVVPDYIGLDHNADLDGPPATRHAWMAIEPTAVASLDALRAAEALLAGELSDAVQLTDQRALVGNSQGGHAVLGVDLLGPHYAPEIVFDAALASLPIGDLADVVQAGMDHISSSTAVSALTFATFREWYRGAQPLDAVLTSGEPARVAETTAGFLEAGCFGATKAFFNGFSDPAEIFTPEALAAAAAGLVEGHEPWSCFLRENSPVHTTRLHRTRATPMLFQVSGEDEIVPRAGSRAAFGTLCGMGYQLEYLECAGVTHTKGGVDSLPEQLDWLSARLAGQPIPAADLCRLKDAVTCTGDSPL